MEKKRSFLDSIRNIFQKGPKKPEERRKFSRKKKTYIGEVEFKGEKASVTVNNVSRGGMGLSLSQKLDIGSEIKVTLLHEFTRGLFSGEKISLTLPARVVWTRKTSSGESPQTGAEDLMGKSDDYETGLQLDGLDEDQRSQYNSLLEKLEEEEKNEAQ